MVTTSSTEAELLALVDGVKSLPLLKILGDIGFKAHAGKITGQPFRCEPKPNIFVSDTIF